MDRGQHGGGSGRGDAQFGFDRRGTVFRMRIDELTPGKRVVWSCLGDTDDWKGTRLTWEIAPGADGSTLRFTHAGWKGTTDYLAMCNTAWGELMHRLRDYAEGKMPGPRWRE